MRQIIFIAIAVVAVSLVGVAILDRVGTEDAVPHGTPRTDIETGSDSSATRSPAPSGIAVPDTDSRVAGGVARPITVLPAAPGAEARFREFNLEWKNNTVLPDTVIAREGDTVRLNLVAADKNYDFAQPDYHLEQSMKKGETRIVQFQARITGTFTFFCRACGGPERGPVGRIVIVPAP